MRTLLLTLMVLPTLAFANQAADNLARLQNQQHIWATQRHHQAERNRAYQEGIQRSQQRTNRVLQGQPPQIGTYPGSQYRGW